MIPIEFKAYDGERKTIVDVLIINFRKRIFRNKTDTKVVSAFLFNGYVSYEKIVAEKSEKVSKYYCVLLPYTDQTDKSDEKIYLDDLLKDEKGIIYRVTWNRNTTQYWLEPLLFPTPEVNGHSILEHVIASQPLGNGYFKRRDLEKIGNYHVDASKYNIETKK